jgi:hypothetical protein
MDFIGGLGLNPGILADVRGWMIFTLEGQGRIV